MENGKFLKISDELHFELKKIAIEEQRTLTAVVVRLLKKAISQQTKKKQGMTENGTPNNK